MFTQWQINISDARQKRAAIYFLPASPLYKR